MKDKILGIFPSDPTPHHLENLLLPGRGAAGAAAEREVSSPELQLSTPLRPGGWDVPAALRAWDEGRANRCNCFSTPPAPLAAGEAADPDESKMIFFLVLICIPGRVGGACRKSEQIKRWSTEHICKQQSMIPPAWRAVRCPPRRPKPLRCDYRRGGGSQGGKGCGWVRRHTPGLITHQRAIHRRLRQLPSTSAPGSWGRRGVRGPDRA